MSFRVNEVTFNYTIAGCGETINGTATRAPQEDKTAMIDLNGTSLVYERGVNHLCCRKVEVNYTMDNQIINIYEKWSGLGCRCECYTDIKAIINGLSQGEYVVNVYETGIEPETNETMTPRLLVTQIVQHPGLTSP